MAGAWQPRVDAADRGANRSARVRRGLHGSITGGEETRWDSHDAGISTLAVVTLFLFFYLLLLRPTLSNNGPTGET